jgi:hypothetical protein
MSWRTNQPHIISTIMSPFIEDPEYTAFLETGKFDFIIVVGGGAGTSGLVVATRLTEDQNIRVLVIEAGANHLDDPRIVTPRLAASLYDDPDFDWCFMSTPQVRTLKSCDPNPVDSEKETLKLTTACSAKR